MHTFADFALAQRIEELTCRENRRFAEATSVLYPELGATWIDVAGGGASYNGPASPVNSAWGLGFAGEVTESDVETVERFFRERGEPPVASVCPLAHKSLLRRIGERGWTAKGFENVLVRDLSRADDLPTPDAHVEIAFAETTEERELWGLMVATGFAAPEDPTPPDLRLGRAAAAREDTLLLLARIDGAPAGTGELHLEDGVGWLSADTTLPQFRGRGVQRSLQRARLRLARDAGCDLAVSESNPGTGSQRNMERLGFRVAYTHVEFAAQARG